ATSPLCRRAAASLPPPVRETKPLTGRDCPVRIRPGGSGHRRPKRSIALGGHGESAPLLYCLVAEGGCTGGEGAVAFGRLGVRANLPQRSPGGRSRRAVPVRG